MNARRKLTVALGAGVAVAMVPLAVWPQQTTGPYRIAVLVAGSRTSTGRFVDAFQKRMQSNGYLEGRNVTYDLRFGEGRNESFPEVVQDILNQRPAIIVLSGSGPAHAAKAATSTVPIVMAGVGDPVGTGLVPSLSRPGGNITGIGLLVDETIAKEIQLLREVIPRATRIAILINSTNPVYRTLRPKIEQVAKALKVLPIIVDVGTVPALESGLSAAATSRIEALVITSDGFFISQARYLVDYCRQHRIPSTYPGSYMVEQGGLMSYVSSQLWRWERAAEFVTRILKGSKPGVLPIEQPTQFDLVLNLKTAQEIGITIPQSVLVRADRVIE